MNKQKDRLVELLKEVYPKTRYIPMEECREKIADAILTDGWMRPPCKVGDIVFAKYSATNEIECYVIDKVIHNGSNSFSFEAHLENEDGYVVDILEFDNVYIGITVFLTREEAEAKLKEGVQG